MAGSFSEEIQLTRMNLKQLEWLLKLPIYNSITGVQFIKQPCWL